MAPPLSVVLPVHDGMPYVEESVRSLLAQSFRDFELVIGDDGSTDGTREVAERLAAADPRIRLLRRERASGLANAGNWVVRAARAPIVAVAHADDRAHPDRLQMQMRLLAAERDVDLVGTLWTGIDHRGRLVRPADYWRLLVTTPLAPFSHSSIMFRREAFERAGGYRSGAEYWEDLDLYYRIAAEGRIAVLPFPYSVVRHSDASTILRARQERVEDKIHLMLGATAAVRAGGMPEPPDCGSGSLPARLHPLTFVRCGSTNIWNGRRPGTLQRLRARGDLRFDVPSLQALLWLLWGTASPRSLRAFLRLLMHARNLAAKPLLRHRAAVDWMPLSPGERSAARAAPEGASLLLSAGR